MDAGLQHELPERRADDQIGREGGRLRSIKSGKDGDRPARGRQRPRRQIDRVEGRDDHHCAQVVDDGQGGQEDLQGGGDPRAEQGQDAQGKGDVGRRRNRPAVESGRSETLNGDIDQGRDRHARRSGDAGQGATRPCRQFSVQQLAFDLESDQEKEQGHQPVVDPVQRVEAAERGVQRREIGVGDGRVGDRERQAGGDDQDDAAGGFVPKQASKS
ncbi:hypothetical protein D3C71_1428660 [compost metagenome]